MDRGDPVGLGHDLFAHVRDGRLDEELRVGQPFDVAAHQVGELGVDLADAGDQPQPDLVAQVFGRAVRRVLAEGNLLRHGVFQNLAARSEHQRSHHPSHAGADPRQPAQPRTAQQVDEKGLDRVVGVVRHGDGRIAVLAPQLLEPRIAQPAGRHLHRLARALHFGRRVEPPVVARHAVAGRLARYGHLVLVALGAAQLEIAVRHAEPIAQRGHERQQHHRIDAARNGQQNTVVAGKEPVALDVGLKTVGQHLCIELRINRSGRVVGIWRLRDAALRAVRAASAGGRGPPMASSAGCTCTAYPTDRVIRSFYNYKTFTSAAISTPNFARTASCTL